MAMLSLPLLSPLFHERESGTDSETVLASHLADLGSDKRATKEHAV